MKKNHLSTNEQLIEMLKSMKEKITALDKNIDTTELIDDFNIIIEFIENINQPQNKDKGSAKNAIFIATLLIKIFTIF